MYKTLSEFNNAVYDYLCDLVSGYGVLPEFYEECHHKDIMEVIEYCEKNKYLVNLTTWHDGYGDIHAAAKGSVSITRDGLAFIEAHSATNVKKVNRKANFANVQSWIAILIALATLIASFLNKK